MAHNVRKREGIENEKAPGTLAQVVEQWTENPCVLGSTPRGTTKKPTILPASLFFRATLTPLLR